MKPPQPVNLEALRSRVFDDFVPLPDYARALGCCERTAWTYVKQGLPLIYIGQKAYVSLTLAGDFWRLRIRRHPAPAKLAGPRRVARTPKETVTA